MLHNLKKLLQKTQLVQHTKAAANQAEVTRLLIAVGTKKDQHFTGMNKFKCFSLLVLLIAWIDGATITSSAHAAPSEAVLTAENNELSQANVDQVIAFYEWAFSAKFTIGQRNEFQSILATNFRKDPAATRKNIDAVISNYEQALAKSEAQQSQIRQAFS